MLHRSYYLIKCFRFLPYKGRKLTFKKSARHLRHPILTAILFCEVSYILLLLLYVGTATTAKYLVTYVQIDRQTACIKLLLPGRKPVLEKFATVDNFVNETSDFGFGLAALQ